MSELIWSRHDPGGVKAEDVLEAERYVSFHGDYGYEVLRIIKVHPRKRTVRVAPHCPGRSREVLIDKIIAVYERR